MLDTASRNVTIITDVTSVEMFSLLNRRVREGSLSSADLPSLGNTFLAHAEIEYVTVPLDKDVLTRERALVERRPLRALDAIQLASAQQAVASLGEPIIFVSSDRGLLAAADAEGLATDDPSSHP